MVAEKGVESVKIEVSGDPKAGFTLIGAISEGSAAAVISGCERPHTKVP
jgi:hypothetical protein